MNALDYIIDPKQRKTIAQKAANGMGIVHSTKRYDNRTNNLTDVLIDLLHFANQEDKDFDAALAEAKKVYNADIGRPDTEHARQACATITRYQPSDFHDHQTTNQHEATHGPVFLLHGTPYTVTCKDTKPVGKWWTIQGKTEDLTVWQSIAY